MTVTEYRRNETWIEPEQGPRTHHVGSGDLYGDQMAPMYAWQDSETEYATPATWADHVVMRPLGWCARCGRSDPSEPDPRPFRVQKADGPCECSSVDHRTALLPTVGVGRSADDRGSVRADMTPEVMAINTGKVAPTRKGVGTSEQVRHEERDAQGRLVGVTIVPPTIGHGRTVRPEGGRITVRRLSRAPRVLITGKGRPSLTASVRHRAVVVAVLDSKGKAPRPVAATGEARKAQIRVSSAARRARNVVSAL